MHLAKGIGTLFRNALNKDGLGLTCTFSILVVLIEFCPVPNLKSLGFYCGDPKINHKYSGDTINVVTLLSISFIAPLITCLLIEYSRSSNCNSTYPVKKLNWFRLAFLWCKEYFIGFLFCYLIIVVAKVLVGEPRPHFLDTCKPEQADNCTQGYISHYTCRNVTRNTEYIIRDSYRSFPSGHAALSVYAAVFSLWYLQRRMKPVTYTLLPILQVMCVLWAVLCSLTRITDHRHHWWDVLAGSLVGITTSIYVVRIFCCDFNPDSYQNIVKLKNSVSDVKEHSILHYDGNMKHVSVRRLLPTPSCITENHYELNQTHGSKFES